MMFYGLPLHIVRDLLATLRSFVHRIKDVVRFRRATSNMDQRYPDATSDELNQSDRTCIICREEMLAGKKLPCGHIFHFICLRSWLERQQACPTCRRPVLDEASPAAAARVPAIRLPAEAAQNQAVPAQPPVRQGPLSIRQSDSNAPMTGGSHAPSSSRVLVASAASNDSLQGTSVQGSASQRRQAATPVEPSARPIGIQTPQGMATAVPVVILPQASTSTSKIRPSSSGLRIGGRKSPSGEMSDEQLATIEKLERDNLYAQIEFLKNVQSQINSVVSSMSQYEQILTRMSSARTSRLGSSNVIPFDSSMEPLDASLKQSESTESRDKGKEPMDQEPTENELKQSP